MVRCRPKIHDVVNLYEYHDEEENERTENDTNDDTDDTNNNNKRTMPRNHPRKTAHGVVFEQESSHQRIIVSPEDDNHPPTASTSKELHNGSNTKQKASFLRTRVLSQPQSKQQQQQQHQSSPTSVKDTSSMYYNDQTVSEPWTNRTGGAATAVGRVTEMIVLDDYVSSAEEEDTTNNNSNNKAEGKSNHNKSFASRMRQRRNQMNDNNNINNNYNNSNDGGNNKQNDDTMLWYQFLQTSDWERWYDSLVKCKHKKRCITPDMILIPSVPISTIPATATATSNATSNAGTTTTATRTVLHDAVWKAPTSLTLLLLDVLTTCPTTPILDEDEGGNDRNEDDDEGGVSTPSSLPKMKQKMIIRKKRMIQKYLLCGDEVGNTPLHLACANLDRTIITTTTTQTTTSNSTAATPTTPITTTTTSGNTKSNKVINGNKTIKGSSNNEDATTATLTTTTTTTTTIDFSVIKNLLLLGPEALCMQNHVGDTPLHLLLSSNAYQQPRYQKSTERDSSSDSIAFANTVPKAVESVMAFLSMSKELAIIQNKNGLTPLHVAIANHCAKSVLQLLLTVEPKAATLLDKDGMNVLHYIAAFGAVSWTFVEQLLTIHPEFVYQQTIHGDTPLHLLIANTSIAYFPGMKNDFTKAFTYHDSRHTMKLLMILLGNTNDDNLDDSSTADSKAITKIKPTIMIQNAHGDTPLHFCARMNSPTLLTQTLMQSSFAVNAATIEADTDMTPLRIAMSTLFRVGDSHDAVGLRNAMGNVVALATLESCVLFDSNHLSPLMHAVQSKKWSAVLVKIILQVHSDTAKQVTPDGLIPLHYACQNSKIKTSTLKELLKAYPSGIKCVTKERDTPLHYAAIAGVESVLDFLIRKHPKAVQQRNVHGEWPIDLAIKFGIDPNVLDCFDISRLSPNIEKQ